MTPPAIRLLNLQRIARNAQRRGQQLDPQRVLDIIEGKEA